MKGRLAETEKSNNNLKESTREVLDDFSQLKQLVLLTMEEICGKIKEKEKKVVKVKKKYKKLADHCKITKKTTDLLKPIFRHE